MAVSIIQSSLDELDFSKVLGFVARYCHTEVGAETVRDFTPYEHAAVLRRELDAVQEAYDVVISADPIPFERFHDVRDLLSKSRIEGNFLSASQLLHMQEMMAIARLTRQHLQERSATLPTLFDITEPLVDNRMLEKHITEAIDDTGTVRDNASKELLEIRREINELSSRLRTRLQRILRKFGEDEILQDEFISQRDGRFVLPLRAENKRTVPGIIHGVSQSGSTVFMEPAETFEMNNDLSLLHNREQREVVRILMTLTAEVGAVSHELQMSVDILVHIDTLLARARYAVEHGGLKPAILDDLTVELHKVHHPVLIDQARLNKSSVVPLNVSFDPSTRGILISGPNAGGKTVAMKTIGLSIAMAMCGIFPLGTCRTPVLRLFTAIGDHQSIDSNLSTFSSQIIRIRDILSECGPDAFVMIDEICAGTDPAEGGALAAGILDSLLERGAMFVITTHQSSLKQYALTRPSISNASLAFDEERLQPTFRFLPGVPGNSYAFVLAKNVGLPAVVLQRAQEYLGDRHNELEQSISAMQRFRQEAESLKMKAAEEFNKAERTRKDYDERSQQIRKKRSELIDEARDEAREVLRKAQSLVENTIREVREQQKSAQTIKNEFELGKQEIVQKQSPPKVVGELQDDTIEIGSQVTITGTTSSGTVITIDPKAKNAVIEVNGMKFSVPVASLEKSTGQQSGRSGGKSSSYSQSTGQSLGQTSGQSQKKRDEGHIRFDSSTSLDLRGMRAAEGIRELEQFIDRAVLTNIPFGTIIHGKGTGAMRTAVLEYLKENPQVKSYRLGEIAEGGDGVTILEF